MRSTDSTRPEAPTAPAAVRLHPAAAPSRPRALLGTFAGLVLIVAACGGAANPQATPTPGGGTATTPAGGTPAGGTPATTAGASQPGGGGGTAGNCVKPGTNTANGSV
jgi:hypothetical protein